MTVQQFSEQTGCRVLCGGSGLEHEILGGYCGDLLSWIISRANAGDAWMTVMGNVNSIGVAALGELACIVLTDNAPLDETAKQKAEQNGIAVLQTDKSAYAMAVLLASLLQQ